MSLSLGNIWSKKSQTNLSNNNSSNNSIIMSRTMSNRPTKIPKKINNGMGTKAYWGTPTWLLFHTLAEKANPEKYKKYYLVVWEFIKEVCGGLPCPYCKQHAVNYVNSISISSINTKEKLINKLFEFHNDVNVKTGKSKSNNVVLYKYKSANLNKILKLFLDRFFVSYIGRRQFDDWIKNKLKTKTDIFLEFYIANIL